MKSDWSASPSQERAAPVAEAKCKRCDDTGCPECDPEWAKHQMRASPADEAAITAKIAAPPAPSDVRKALEESSAVVQMLLDESEWSHDMYERARRSVGVSRAALAQPASPSTAEGA